MKILKKIFVALLILGCLFLILEFYIYNHLDYNQKPQKSDVIIYLDGGDTARFKKAVNLYKAHYADKIIVTKTVESKEYNNIKYLESLGVKSKDLIKEKKATSTWTNAVESIKIMKKNKYKSALVVTNDFHGARAKLSFDRAAKGTDLKIRIITTKDKDNNSYQNSNIFKSTVRREIIVLPAYWLGLYKFFDL